MTDQPTVMALNPRMSLNSESTGTESGQIGQIQKSRPRKSPADFAIQSMFTEFVKHSETKLTVILNHALDQDLDLGFLLAHGADERYDQILMAMGSLAKHRPRPIIDAVMIWRKVKSEPIDVELIQTIAGAQATGAQLKETENLLKERKTLASNFILNRALIEIVRSLKPEGLAGDLGDKLEEMVFSQLRNTDPEFLIGSKNRLLIIDLFSELIGMISTLRFSSVSEKFVEELRKASALRENKLELMIRCMRFIQLKLYPMDALDDSVEFLTRLAEYFRDAHSTGPKHAYTQVLVDLLEPVAAVAVAEVNIPSWMKAVDMIYQRGMRMLAKPRHYHLTLPLMTTLLCVSRRDFFLDKWSYMVDFCYQRFKDRSTRLIALDSLARLLWVYIYRYSEAITTTYKKLDAMVKTMFPPGRRTINPPETDIHAVSKILELMLFRHPEFTIKHCIHYLLGFDQSFSSMESLAPERIMIGIRLFLVLVETPRDYTPPYPRESMEYPSGRMFHEVTDSRSEALFASQVVHHRESMQKLRAMLGKIVKILDQSLGGLLLTDEKNMIKLPGTINSSSSFSTSFSEGSGSVANKEKQPFYELMCAWLDLIPRIEPSEIDATELCGVICKYTAHVDPDIAKSAYDAVLRMSHEKRDTQIMVIRCLRLFILSVNDKCTEVIDRSVKLLVDVSEAFVESISNDFTKEPATKTMLTEDSLTLWEIVQDLEMLGLLFMSSFMPVVRAHAFQLSKLAADLASKILETKKLHTSSESINVPTPVNIYRVLQSSIETLLGTFSSDFSSFVEAFSEKKSNLNFLMELGRSESSSDSHYWAKIFPLIVRRCFDSCPTVVHLCLEEIWKRFVAIHPSIIIAADPSKLQNATLTGKWSLRNMTPASDEMIEQWKYYMMFSSVCVTTSEPERKPGKRNQDNAKMVSAQELFSVALPLLASEKSSIRVAVVLALGHVNGVILKDLLLAMSPLTKAIVEDMRARYMRGSQKRVRRLEKLRSEVTHMLSLMAGFVLDEHHVKDDQVIVSFLSFIREMGSFLSDNEVQTELDHQMLRYYFCGLIERFYDSVSKYTDPSGVVPFDLRHSLFKLTEEWCGYGNRGVAMREREAKVMLGILEQIKDVRERAALTSAMEEQRKALEFASLKTMASLCKGPITADRSKVSVSFGVASLFEWIEATFNSDDPRFRPIAQRALESVLKFNVSVSSLWEDVIICCYQGGSSADVTRGYFKALAEISCQSPISLPCSRIVTIALFKIADEDFGVRQFAFRLLEAAELQFFGNQDLGEFLIAASSPVSSTYRQAQIAISQHLSRLHSSITNEMISEIIFRMNFVDQPGQLLLLSCLRPWIRNVDLVDDERFGQLSQMSYLILWNIFYLTIRFADTSEKEIEGLWCDLALNPNHLPIIIAFLINLGVERKSFAVASPAKKVILFIGRTKESANLIEVMMSQLTPKSLIPVKKSRSNHFQGIDSNVFYIASIDDYLDEGSRKVLLSKGQLLMAFLVDLTIECGDLLESHLPVLLHCLFVQLDHFNAFVKEESRRLLIALLQSFARKSKGNTNIELMSELLKTEGKDLWLNDTTNKKRPNCPAELESLMKKVLLGFSTVAPNIQQSWGDVAVKWAALCPVRHVACRSLQVFRILNPLFTQKMLVDFLARLSNTIADPSADVQGFAYEILKTLKVSTSGFDSGKILLFPQLFWAALACLQSCHEDEFSEAAEIVLLFFEKLDLNDSSILNIIWSNKPFDSHLFGEGFPGIQPIVMKGMSSTQTEVITSRVLERIFLIEEDVLIDTSGLRWLFAMMAQLPRFLCHLDSTRPFTSEEEDKYRSFAQLLALHNYGSFAKIWDPKNRARYRSSEDFMKQLVMLLRDSHLQNNGGRILLLLISFLRNDDIAHQSRMLKLLRMVVMHVDSQDPVFEMRAPELVVPLFQLLRIPSLQNDVLEALDEIIRLSCTKDDKNARILYGNRAIHKMTKELVIDSGILTKEGWSFTETDMRKTRAEIANVVSTFISVLSMSEADANDMELTKQHWIEASKETMIAGDSLHGFENYDELLSALEDLDDFFTEDIAEKGRDQVNVPFASDNDLPNSSEEDEDDAEVMTVSEPLLENPREAITAATLINNDTNDTTDDDFDNENDSSDEDSLDATFSLEKDLENVAAIRLPISTPTRSHSLANSYLLGSPVAGERSNILTSDETTTLPSLTQLKNRLVSARESIAASLSQLAPCYTAVTNLHKEFSDYTKKHLLAMSGRAEEEDVKRLIVLIRNIQSLTIPEFAGLFVDSSDLSLIIGSMELSTKTRVLFESLESKLDSFESLFKQSVENERLVMVQLRSMSASQSRPDSRGDQKTAHPSILANLSSLHCEFSSTVSRGFSELLSMLNIFAELAVLVRTRPEPEAFSNQIGAIQLQNDEILLKLTTRQLAQTPLTDHQLDMTPVPPPPLVARNNSTVRDPVPPPINTNLDPSLDPGSV